MRRTTFSVVFFCKKARISKKGKAPIYARITTSGHSTEIYTRCQIEPNAGTNGWNAPCIGTRWPCKSTAS